MKNRLIIGGGVCVNTSDKWRNRRFTKAFNKTWDTIEKLRIANRKKFYAAEWKCRNAVWAAITAKKNKSAGGGVSLNVGSDLE